MAAAIMLVPATVMYQDVLDIEDGLLTQAFFHAQVIQNTINEDVKPLYGVLCGEHVAQAIQEHQENGITSWTILDCFLVDGQKLLLQSV